MGFAKTAFTDPLAEDDAVESMYFAELEALTRRQIEELTRLVAQHEKDRARCEALYQIVREDVWKGPAAHPRTRAVA